MRAVEAMQEFAVTYAGRTYHIDRPFFILATQNPIEQEGTYPLPEAQLDRFLLKLEVGHPSQAAEAQILLNYVAGFDPGELSHLAQVSSQAAIVEMQRALGHIRIAREIIDYVTDIVRRTRTHPSVSLGASPRASIGLLNVARAHALWEGRDFVIPDDVKSYAHAVLRHRLQLQPDAELEGITADHCVDAVLRDAVVPKTSA